MEKYRDVGHWLQSQLGCRVQKISVDAGFACPNRDGRIGKGGCTFCLPASYTPRYCSSGDSIAVQIEKGKQFFARKYPAMKYLAYFQAGSNTYAPLSLLRAKYEEALAQPDVVGLVIGTRPDCVNEELLDYLQMLAQQTFLLVEYGVESCSDETLRLVHRGHTFAQSKWAISQTALRGIHVGAHVILGFPWETRQQLLQQADLLATLPLTTLKLHQLQILKGTPLAEAYEKEPWSMNSAQEYAHLLRDYISRLPDHIILDRFVSQSPSHLVLSPRWGLKSQEFMKLLS